MIRDNTTVWVMNDKLSFIILSSSFRLLIVHHHVHVELLYQVQYRYVRRP